MRKLDDLHHTISKIGRSLAAVLVAGAACWLMALAAEAQQVCTFTDLTGPLRQQVSCGEAMTFEREPGTRVSIAARGGGVPPRTIDLEGGAILIRVVPGQRRTVVRTPHAIAAVRGTTYVVDAGPDSTSVFVIEGAVDVRKRGLGSTAKLRPGQGIDVAADRPLEVKTWGAARASALLARFGR